MLVTVGRVGRAHGIRGDVAVSLRTDDPQRRLAPGVVLRTEPESSGPLTVARARWHSGRLLVGFAGVEDRDRAEQLHGVSLLAEVAEDETPEEPDTWYDRQLVGLSAVTVEGHRVGEVVDVLHLPAQDVLVVRREDRTDVLVPFVTQIVPHVDLPTGRVVLDPPLGLLDPSEAQQARPDQPRTGPPGDDPPGRPRRR